MKNHQKRSETKPDDYMLELLAFENFKPVCLARCKVGEGCKFRKDINMTWRKLMTVCPKKGYALPDRSQFNTRLDL
jgi:hypothetical protein